MLTEEPWEGKESDRIDFGKFIPKDVRRTGHDTAMTPEDVYCAPYYRNNVEWSLVEEDSAQAGFARVLPMETPFSMKATSPLANPGDPHQGEAGGGAGCVEAGDGPDHSGGKCLADGLDHCGGKHLARMGQCNL